MSISVLGNYSIPCPCCLCHLISGQPPSFVKILTNAIQFWFTFPGMSQCGCVDDLANPLCSQSLSILSDTNISHYCTLATSYPTNHAFTPEHLYNITLFHSPTCKVHIHWLVLKHTNFIIRLALPVPLSTRNTPASQSFCRFYTNNLIGTNFPFSLKQLWIPVLCVARLCGFLSSIPFSGSTVYYTACLLGNVCHNTGHSECCV